jgi:predicted amidophosphoribosyltransferase
LVDHAVQRQRYTRAQVGLNQQERLANVQDAFLAEPSLISGLRVLLLDDVLTTGATMAACAASIRAAGAGQVYGLCVSHAVLK